MKHSKKNPNILSALDFAKRMFRFFLITTTIILFSLLIGVLGYHFIANLSWIDSLYNASMILGGMGPVDILKEAGAKFFASMYALFSGVVFLANVAILFSPIAHRLMHMLHIPDEDEV